MTRSEATFSPSRQMTSIDRLRAIAVFCVTIGHVFDTPALFPFKTLVAPVYVLIASGTVLFVLIAGILFQERAIPRLETGNTTTREIFARRWRELSGIYLGLGGLLAVLIVWHDLSGVAAEIGTIPFFLRLMLNGSMAHSYWYVPFFLALMALTPIHQWMARQPDRVQIPIIVAGLILASFIHRPNKEVTHAALHALVYYLPIFWGGMLLARHWALVTAALAGREALLAGLTLGCAALQVAIGQTGVLLEAVPDMRQVDLFTVQKLLFAAFFIAVFERAAHLPMPLLDWLARHSLTIFFMHPLILIIAARWVPHLSGFYVPELVLFSTFVFLSSVRLDAAGRRALGILRDRLSGFSGR